MKRLVFSLTACIAAIGLSPTQQDAGAEPASLRVTIVIPRIWRPIDNIAGRMLINQQHDASFNVLIENISKQPVRLATETTPLSFEVTLGDGKIIKLSQQQLEPSGRVKGYYLEPGDYHVIPVYYATQEQYIAQTHHAPPGGRGWDPEFPFKRGGPRRLITLRAIYEEKPQGINSRFWTGRAVSNPVEVELIQG